MTAAPIDAVLLGNNTKKPSNVVPQRLRSLLDDGSSCAADSAPKPTEIGRQNEPPNQAEKRRARYALRDVLATVTEFPRVRLCGKKPISRQLGDEPQILCKEDGERRIAHYSRLALCSRVWVCPVCGPRIRQVRAEDLDAAAVRWIERHGQGSLQLLTLTLPHDFYERLTVVLGSIRAAYSSLVSGRYWQEDKADFGLAHYVRAHDVTLGRNGWHPHLHAVLFSRRRLTEKELDALYWRLFERWARAVEKTHRRRPSSEHGVTLEQARSFEDVNRYVCQVVVGERGERTIPVAYELARGDLKTSRFDGHRTPWQVLADVGEHNDANDRRAWREWEQATRGVHAIRWSKGLRKELELDADLTDEEIVAIEIGGDVVYQFGSLQWERVRRAAGVPVRLLEAAEEGGRDAVVAVLTAAGLAFGGSEGYRNP